MIDSSQWNSRGLWLEAKQKSEASQRVCCGRRCHICQLQRKLKSALGFVQKQIFQQHRIHNCCLISFVSDVCGNGTVNIQLPAITESGSWSRREEGLGGQDVHGFLEVTITISAVARGSMTEFTGSLQWSVRSVTFLHFCWQTDTDRALWGQIHKTF